MEEFMAMFNEDEIMSEEQISSLFTGTSQEQEEEVQTPPEKEQPANNPPAEEKEVDLEHLFDTSPESVGNGEEQEQSQETPSSDKGTSVLPSLAIALKEEGILSCSDDEAKGIKDVQDLDDLIEKTVKARLDERMARIDKALDNGIEPSVIRQYEEAIRNLDSITVQQVEDNSPQGEALRKNILFRDYMNRFGSEERANREVEKSLRAGSDIEEAKEALESIKETVRNQYDNALNEANQQEEEVKARLATQAKTLRESIMDEKQVFLGDINLDKNTRQKALDALTKPVYRDPKTGEKWSAIQRFEKENRTELLKYMGIFFALTDGFTKSDGLVRDKVKKEKSRAMKEFENVINNTQRTPDGSLNFGGSQDKDSFFREYSFAL